MPGVDSKKAKAPDLSEIDSGWEDVEEPTPKVPPVHTRVAPPHRPLLPTLPEDDPLRHDHEPRKESRPTLPVIDPLKYDLPDE
ncbi:MAG: hypothetical protein KC776_34670 [Myxococcales bacterium]|nr:hypothetical protein [Myxococcales bacterium]MCB9581898.1 hypothetical protein [Polyangiaceae bacterium]